MMIAAEPAPVLDHVVVEDGYWSFAEAEVM